MSDNQFNHAELLAIRVALESQIDFIRSRQSDPEFSNADRNQLLDALKASRSAKKKIGHLIGEAEKYLAQTPSADD